MEKAAFNHKCKHTSYFIFNDNFDHPKSVATVRLTTFGKKVAELVVGANARLGRHIVWNELEVPMTFSEGKPNRL